jgi:threonine aldolase
MPVVINLFSDTQTRPSPEMRQAMASAEVGDEQRMADPTVNALCERVAELLGKESAVFLPSGTMCNEIAIRVHVGAGEAVYLHHTAHPLRFEAGGPAALSGAVLVPLDGPAGMFSDATLEAALPVPGDRYAPRPRLVSIEQTTNVAGGRIWPQDAVLEVVASARKNGLSCHMDGARLMNAVVESRIPAAEWARLFDSVWIDFTKGLGAPVGAVLAGSSDFIDEAWRYKQMWGGAMRQAGIIAAACIYALDHNVDRLAEDHFNARRLADLIEDYPRVQIDPSEVDTNIVIFEVEDAPALVDALKARNVIMGAISPTTVRAVTHMDVSTQDVEAAARAVGEALGFD